jgi:hypothetical protein
MSKRYSLNNEDGLKILQVLGWTVSSAIIAFAIDLIPNIDVGANYAWLVPMINTVLVVLKKFVQDKLE